MGLYKELHKPRSANEQNYISITAKRECAKLSTDQTASSRFRFVEKRERGEKPRARSQFTAFHVCYRYYHHASYNVIFNGSPNLSRPGAI